MKKIVQHKTNATIKMMSSTLLQPLREPFHAQIFGADCTLENDR